jgi:hypothetical protein
MRDQPFPEVAVRGNAGVKNNSALHGSGLRATVGELELCRFSF